MLRKKWSFFEDRNRNFNNISRYFKLNQAVDSNKFILDDRTWKDLDLDIVFSQIDRTLTIPGEQILYSLLRQPILRMKELSERLRLINLFSFNKEIREKLQIFLTQLGRKRGEYLVDMLWDEIPHYKKFTILYNYPLVVIPILIFLIVLNYNNVALFGFIIIFLVNVIIHFRTKYKISEELNSIFYLGKLIHCASNLVYIEHSEFNLYRAYLKKALKKTSKITKKTSLIVRGENNFVYDYFNIFFLVEVRAFYSVLSLVKKYKKQLQEIFKTIGHLDAMISVSSYRAGLTEYVEPKFNNSSFYIKTEEIVHPLLKDPISNSITVKSNGILITGSNMSGKTTFLKTIGVNLVLGQTINTCLARKFESQFFKIYTMIGREDNIIEGKSYYLDEVSALLRIVKTINKEPSRLCLLDELFRGTNSIERISASSEILLYLAKQGFCIFATTHDLELTRLVNSHFCNYHFQEDIQDYGIAFTFKIRKGVSSTRSAISLLRYLDYPKEITSAAEKKIQTIKEFSKFSIEE